MTRLVALLHLMGYLALALTYWSAILGAYKRRDLRRLDILLVVLGLVIVSPLSTTALLRGGLPAGNATALLLFPYLLLRLTQHFRDVHIGFVVVALGAPVIGALVSSLTPLPWPLWHVWGLSSYLIGALVFSAAALSWESHRSSGVTAKRLVFAAAGTWLFVGVHTLVLVATVWEFNKESGARLSRAAEPSPCLRQPDLLLPGVCHPTVPAQALATRGTGALPG